MKIFCNHKWEKVSEITLPSTIEQISKLNLNAENKEIIEKLLRKKYLDFEENKYLLILKCSECGKLDKTSVSNHRW